MTLPVSLVAPSIRIAMASWVGVVGSLPGGHANAAPTPWNSRDASAESPPEPTDPIDGDPALEVAARDSGLRLVPSGLLQVDLVAFRQSSEDQLDAGTGGPLNEDRFLLRRGLFRLDAATPYTAARIELEMSTLRQAFLRPRQAWLELRAPQLERLHLEAQVGFVQIPFGSAAQTPLAEMPWLERATFVQAFFPGQHDLGAVLHARYDVLGVSFAAMNGEPIGEVGFVGLDPNRSKDVIGRSFAHIALSPKASLEFGASWLLGTGFHPGTPRTKDELSFRDNNENGLVEVSELRVTRGTAATASSNFDRFALGGDARLVFRIGPCETSLEVELARGQNLDRGVERADPVQAGRDLREFGVAFSVAQRWWQRLGVALRYDEYNPDTDALRYRGLARVPRDATYRTWSAAGYLDFEAARILLEYDHRQNSLGIDDAGAPTTLHDDAFTLRGQYVLR